MDSKKAEKLYKKGKDPDSSFMSNLYLPMTSSGVNKTFSSHGWKVVDEHDSGILECLDPSGDIFLIKREDGPWAGMVRIPKEKVQ